MTLVGELSASLRWCTLGVPVGVPKLPRSRVPVGVPKVPPSAPVPVGVPPSPTPKVLPKEVLNEAASAGAKLVPSPPDVFGLKANEQTSPTHPHTHCQYLCVRLVQHGSRATASRVLEPLSP